METVEIPWEKRLQWFDNLERKFVVGNNLTKNDRGWFQEKLKVDKES